MQTSNLDSFKYALLTDLAGFTGGGGSKSESCNCKEKGNNGIGNGCDPAPPGLAKQERQDFNDGYLCTT